MDLGALRRKSRKSNVGSHWHRNRKIAPSGKMNKSKVAPLWNERQKKGKTWEKPPFCPLKTKGMEAAIWLPLREPRMKENETIKVRVGNVDNTVPSTGSKHGKNVVTVYDERAVKKEENLHDET